MRSEEEMQRLEQSIPGFAQAAFQRAYMESLAAGPTVVRRGDDIVRVFPDGREEVIKPARPLVLVQPDLRIDLW